MRGRLLIVLLLAVQFVNAQSVELGLQLGGANYWGDLSPSIALSETKGTVGIFARLNINNTWAWNNQINYMRVSGADSNFEANKFRNLSFRSSITEFSSIFEYNFFNYGPYVLDKKFTTYVYTGISGFAFNAQALLDDTWYDLSDYKTEGKQYSKYGIAIPMGMGFKWMPNNRFAIEGQVGFRKTYTDYLDDVSTVYPNMDQAIANGRITGILTDRSTQNTGGVAVNKTGYKRGNPDYNDWYMTATVSLAIRIGKRVKCARFF